MQCENINIYSNKAKQQDIAIILNHAQQVTRPAVRFKFRIRTWCFIRSRRTKHRFLQEVTLSIYTIMMSEQFILWCLYMKFFLCYFSAYVLRAFIQILPKEWTKDRLFTYAFLLSQWNKTLTLKNHPSGTRQTYRFSRQAYGFCVIY